MNTVPKSLPRHRTVIVQGDTEFGTIAFLQAVRQRSWRAVVGLRCNRTLTDGRQAQRLGSWLKAGLTSPSQGLRIPGYPLLVLAQTR
ncbi:MAG: hypothetical protein F6K00_15800 [Leptolyngbya sp. SIOISBB]|nr:hypothetical protein [Leptolyngbya sp. SIOISBB]